MSTPYQALILSEAGLVDFWELAELSGATSADAIGPNPCTIGGTYPPTLGQPGIPNGGTSYSFNSHGNNGGVDSYTKDGSAFSIGGSAVSLEAWIYIPGPTYNGRGQFVAGFWHNDLPVWLLLGTTAVPSFTLWTSTTGNSQINGGAGLSVGAWHYLVGTGVAGAMNFYIDSVVQTPIAVAGHPSPNATPDEFAIGGGTNVTFDANLSIANVALYNVVLSQAQVTAHWQLGTTNPALGTIASSAGPDALAASATFTLTGSLAPTERHDTFAASAGNLASASSSPTERHDTLAAAATMTTIGTSAVTERHDTFAAASPDIGTMAVTGRPDVLTATATFLTTAAMAATERNDTAGLVAFTVIVAGTMGRPERRDALAGLGNCAGGIRPPVRWYPGLRQDLWWRRRHRY
jgi:hypothetical protein